MFLLQLIQWLTPPAFFVSSSGLRCNLRRIGAAFAEWVASADSSNAFEAAANRSVLFYANDKVLAASRLKAAIRTQHRANADLVHADAKDQQPRGQTENRFEEFHSC